MSRVITVDVADLAIALDALRVRMDWYISRGYPYPVGMEEAYHRLVNCLASDPEPIRTRSGPRRRDDKRRDALLARKR